MAHIIRKIIREIGYDLVKYHLSSRLTNSFITLLKNQNINMVFDIGANTGQYSYELISRGYGGKIISFEPLTNAYNELKEKSKQFNNWSVSKRCAIGNENKKVKINIANNSESSSVLPMLDAHINGASDSYYVGSEEVEMYTLDYVIEKHSTKEDNLFVKLDVQGYEYSIIENVKNGFEKIKGMQIETSITPLYDGEITFDQIIKFMNNFNYDLYDIIPAYRDLNTKKLLQMDCIFFKNT